MKRILIYLGIMVVPVIGAFAAEPLSELADKLNTFANLGFAQMREQGAEISAVRKAIALKLIDQQKSSSLESIKKALIALKNFDELYKEKALGFTKQDIRPALASVKKQDRKPLQLLRIGGLVKKRALSKKG